MLKLQNEKKFTSSLNYRRHISLQHRVVQLFAGAKPQNTLRVGRPLTSVILLILVCNLTAECRKLLGSAVGENYGQRLLPVWKLRVFDYRWIVLLDHSWDELTIKPIFQLLRVPNTGFKWTSFQPGLWARALHRMQFCQALSSQMSHLTKGDNSGERINAFCRPDRAMLGYLCVEPVSKHTLVHMICTSPTWVTHPTIWLCALFNATYQFIIHKIPVQP